MSTQKYAAVIFNPAKVDEAALRKAVAAQENKLDFQTSEWYETTPEDAGQGATKTALKSKPSLVIAAGGDGTVRAVAEVLSAQAPRTPLGLVPAGTGNLLARNLNIMTTELSEAVATAFTGKTKNIDTGSISLSRGNIKLATHTFLVMAGVGLDSHIIKHTDESLKKRFGWVAYALAIVKSIRTVRGMKMTITERKRSRTTRTTTYMVGNCSTLTGNVTLFPDAQIDDGKLDTLQLTPRSHFDWLRIAGKVIIKNTLMPANDTEREHAAFQYAQMSAQTLNLKRPQFVEIDGDIVGEATMLVFKTHKQSLAVRVARD